MKYCKNCGKENTKKICVHCGADSRKAHNYCAWCGNEINEKVIVCPNCHEKQKDGIGAKIGALVGIAFFVFFLSAALVFYALDGALSLILSLVAAVLSLPFINGIIRKMTFGSSGKRKALSILRIVAILAVFIIACCAVPEAEPAEVKVYKDQATQAALEVFHENVKLKNESSFVLNDSKVTYVDSYNGNDNLALVTVVLDYSAQNGFGGMNRDTYTVKLEFNYARNTYTPSSKQ